MQCENPNTWSEFYTDSIKAMHVAYEIIFLNIDRENHTFSCSQACTLPFFTAFPPSMCKKNYGKIIHNDTNNNSSHGNNYNHNVDDEDDDDYEDDGNDDDDGDDDDDDDDNEDLPLLYMKTGMCMVNP